jgi:branched-chain amino acid aminotransferase
MNERSFINNVRMIFYNEEFMEAGAFAVTAGNRAFKYGDGVFETALVINKKVPLLNYNINRLKKGMALLGIEEPSNWNLQHFASIITKLCEQSDTENGRCKITVWRSGGGLYLPVTNTADCLIEIFPQETNPLISKGSPLVLGVYDDYPKMIHPLSACKTSNAIPYILAANYAKQNGFDDVLLLNTNDEIADSISSNLFIVKNNTCYTTSVMNGGVEGTMQAYILANAASLGIKVDRIPMSISDVMSANEVMLTNAISGIKPVTQFQDVVFKNNFAIELLGKLKWLLEQDAK